MIYIKLFEAFIQEPVFYRFSHVDLLNGETELVYHPKERGMMGPESFNSSLVEVGFPDKKKCINFMNSLAFDPSYKSLYGKYTYNIQIDDSSHLGWSFLTAINNWFYRSNPYRNAIRNPICKDLLNTEFKDLYHEKENIDQFDASVVNRMIDILIECGLIGTGTIEDLKSSKYFENQPVFVWTNDEVKISTYQKPSNNY